MSRPETMFVAKAKQGRRGVPEGMDNARYPVVMANIMIESITACGSCGAIVAVTSADGQGIDNAAAHKRWHEAQDALLARVAGQQLRELHRTAK